MKTKTAHTPTPWYTDSNWGFYCPSQNHDAQDVDKKIFEAETEKDATFIVRAVNCHEELVTRMHTLIVSLDSILANVENHKEAFGGSRYAIIRMLKNDIALGKEAIAKAEGK